MRRLRLEQGSPGWQLWRNAGLGASDAPAIMGASPWTSAMKLWRQKVGVEKSEPSTFAMRRGIRLEPKARRLYELRSGHNVRPACVVHDSLDWLRASLDGLDLWESVACEIKAPKVEDHQCALEGEVPAKYRWQLVHQCVVTGLPSIDYVSYNPDSFALEDEFRVVPYTPLPDELDVYLDAATEFWRCVCERREPACTVEQAKEEKKSRKKSPV